MRRLLVTRAAMAARGRLLQFSWRNRRAHASQLPQRKAALSVLGKVHGELVHLTRLVFFATVCLPGPLSTVHAAITWTGNVDPTNPSTWTSSTEAYIGKTAAGTLTVNSGTISSSAAYLGYNSGISGSATISGANSQWTNSSYLYVGNSGSGTLNVTGGGSVSNYFGCCIGENSGATGVVTVDGAGSKWTVRNNLQVSSYGHGTLNVTNGGSVSNAYSYIGAYSNSTGVVTIDGANSTWTSNGDLNVGYSGRGTLNVTNGSAVTVSGTTYVAYSPNATGTINFGSSGGTLTTASLAASPSQLTGTGSVNARGLVSDVDLVLDSTASLTQTLTFNSLPNQNIRLSLNMASSPSTKGVLGAGYQGNGSLTIQNGIAVNSSSGCLGYKSGSVGVVTVDGPNSKWTNGGGLYDSGSLYVGFYGSGTLNVTNGGSVSNSYGYIGFFGYGSGLTSMVTVDGATSKWTNSTDLRVGYSGSGTLNVSGGGAVKAASVSINNSSVLAIDVGRNSSLTVGDGTGGTVYSDGTVRIFAGAGAAAGKPYSPIMADNWEGMGTYQAVGGKWDASDHTFTASAVQEIQPGVATDILLDAIQRVLVNDHGPDGSRWSVGASFVPSSGAATMTASAIDGDATAILGSLLADRHLVLSAFEFSMPDGVISTSNPAYLSFDIGGGFSRNDLDIWHYADGAWSEYSVSDLTYDGTYASFTATSFSSYAVVAAVPEPGTFALVVAAGWGLLGYAWRKRK
jgi:T5SS/PEP-CTERM-associated repeat protein